MKEAMRLGADFIRSAIRGGGAVLVHCHRGISRSPTLALAYLIEEQQRPAEPLFESMRSQRRSIDPNLSYWMMLQEWERLVLPPHVVQSRSSSASRVTPSPRPLSRAG